MVNNLAKSLGAAEAAPCGSAVRSCLHADHARTTQFQRATPPSQYDAASVGTTRLALGTAQLNSAAPASLSRAP